MSHLFSHLVIGREVQDEDMRNLFFGDYVFQKTSVKPEKHYNEIVDIDELKIVSIFLLFYLFLKCFSRFKLKD